MKSTWSFKKVSIHSVAYFALCLSLFVILGFIGYHPLSFDELIQFDVLTLPELPHLLSFISTHDAQLPLVYYLLHPVVQELPPSPVSFRMLSVLCSLASLPLFYRFARFFIPRRESLFALAAFSLHPSFILYAHVARPYALLLFLSLLANVLTQRLVRRSPSLSISFIFDFSLWLVGLFFLALTHYFGLLWCGILFTLVFFKAAYKLSGRRGTKGILGIAGCFYFSCLVLLIFFLFDKKIYSHPQKFFPSLSKFSFNLIQVFGGIIPAVVSCTILSFSFFKEKVKISLKQTLLILGIILPIVAALTLSWFVIPVFEFRFFVIQAPLATVLVMTFLTKQESVRKAFLIALPFSFAFNLLFIKSYLDKTTHPDMPAIMKELKGDEILYACGNCPSFYINKDRLGCYAGWNFKVPPELKAKASVLLIFIENKDFCTHALEEQRGRKGRVISVRGIDAYFFSK